MSDPANSAKVLVRAATPADLPQVVELLSARDAQPRDSQIVSDYLWGLDPQHTFAWLAFAGERPVGITFLYLRDMCWPKAGEDGLVLRAGYWAHLFVEPEFRKQMVYPQLVMAMLRGMKSAGLSAIFTATRQPAVAAGHQKLGFQLVAKLPLRIRPLRPFRLLAKHRDSRAISVLARPMDWMAHLVLCRRYYCAHQLVDVEPDPRSPQVGQIVELLNRDCARFVTQLWSADQFCRRFRTTLDGTPYRIRAVMADDRVVAATVSVLAERGNNIRACVLLALVMDPHTEPNVLPALLADIESYAYDRQAELVLSLSDSLAQELQCSRGGKYLTNRSELYHLLVYPKQMAQSPYAAANIDNWQFQFADHDAF